MKRKIKRAAELLQKLVRRVSNASKYRCSFGRLHAGYTYPIIEDSCTFKDSAKIHLGNSVHFMKGCSVIADSGRIEMDDYSTICRFSILQACGGSIKIGKNSCIGDFCNLYGQGGLVIGDNVMMASCIQIVPNQHTFDDLEAPISLQPTKASGIRIEDNCWIGTNVVILDGVRIGKGAVIGAGSVVTKDVPDYSIVAGVPAKILRYRPGYKSDSVASGLTQ